MVIFEKTPRSVEDLALTRGTSLPFSPRILKRIQSQNLQTNFEVAENQRLRNLAKAAATEKARQKSMFRKVESLEIKSETINLDLANKISKIIPYSLIPIIPIVVGYFLIKGRK
mgnify:FL=1